MKTKLLICIWLITSHICTYSQITFKKTFGNTLDQYVGTVKQCLDGGYIIAGSSYFNYHGSTPLYNSSMYVIRTNEYGDTLWIRNFEITLPDKLVYSDVIQNPDGSFILCGSYGNIADHINLYLSKLDANGKTIWILSEGCKGSGNSFYKTFDEGFIVVGDYNLYRTDAVGKKIWCKHVGSGDPYLPLGYVLQSADSNFMATGSTNGYSIINLIKLNTEGNVIWLKHFDYMRPSGGHNLIESPNHEYYLLGSAKYFNKPDSTYHNNTYILKTNSNGDSLWAIEYPYLLKNTFLIQTKDGGYAFTGNTLPENEFYTLNSIYLVKSDANGKVQWTQTYTFPDTVHIFSINETEDGGFIMAGTIKSIPGNGTDIVLIKTDSMGNIFETNTHDVKQINEVIIYPNPFKSTTTIQFKTYSTDVDITIYNLYGEPVKSINHISSIQLEINRKNLPAGLYFISITQNHHIISIEKLLIAD